MHLLLRPFFAQSTFEEPVDNYRPAVNTDLVSFEGRGITIADTVKLYPTLNLKVGTDDNPGKAPDIANPNPQDAKRSSNVFELNAKFGTEIAAGRNGSEKEKVVILVDTSAFGYSSSSVDNNGTTRVSVATNISPSRRLDLKTEANYIAGEDPKGTVNDNRTVNSFSQTSALLGAGYGAPAAKGRVELDLAISNKEYDKDVTNVGALSSQDVEKSSATGRFLYRVAPKTRLFFEAQLAKNEYGLDLSPLANDPQELDSTDTRFSVGAKWDATAKTNGSVNVGVKEREYDVPNPAIGRDNNSNGFWDISVNWSPLEYSTITLSSGQDFADNFANFGQQETLSYGIRWNHKWTDRFSTTVGYRLVEDDFKGYLNPVTNTRVERNDDTDNYFVSADYAMREWLKLGAEVRYEDRKSNLNGNTTGDNFNYDRSIFLLTANAVF